LGAARLFTQDNVYPELGQDSRGGLRAAQSFAAIAERLGDVDARDACLAVEIGKRAGDTQRPVIAARA